MNCDHARFHAIVEVHRMTIGGEVKSLLAEVTIRCADCGQPCRFLGLPGGLNLGGAAVSPDGLEARLAIEVTADAQVPEA